MKKVLFACYGSGHVRMVVPVAKALQAAGLAQVVVLGLTTAAPVVRAAGLPLLQFKDFVQPSDAAALARGRELGQALADVADREETQAYLGLSYADLEGSVGPAEARSRYQRLGRQAFLPVATLARAIDEVRPDLVVATNSPRAERAAILAARAAGIPSVCMVDLFAVDEVRWIGEPGYADRVCVLNEGVREFIVRAGRRPDEVVVTGNPAFDDLLAPANVRRGEEIRREQGWEGKRVVLWPAQAEPAVHPFDQVTRGDPQLPGRVLQLLVDWAAKNEDAVLCVRPRPGEEAPALAAGGRIRLTGQDWPLAPLLHAVGTVVTLTSTVGLEGYLCGARLVQVRGSVFEPAMPLAEFGVADAAVPPEGLADALDRWTRERRRAAPAGDAAATGRVVAVLAEFL